MTPAASLYVTLIWSLTNQKPPGLSRDRQGWRHLFLLLVSGSFNSSVVTTYGRLLAFQVCFWGACTYAKPLTHAQRLRLLGRPVFGLVGVQFGWEGSPTTFGSVTTSYLVHGKKAIH